MSRSGRSVERRFWDFSIPDRNLLPGSPVKGRKDSEFDPVQLRIGIETELEHTSSRKIAKEIAKAHLLEDPKYYVKLRKAGL